MKAIEQLGNLLSRRARHRAQEGIGQDVTDDQEEAARWLQLALDLGRSGERLALMGGFHKRTAAMMTGDERAEHLRQAIDLYHEAHRTTNKAYHELNWRQLVAIARLNGITVDDAPAIESATNQALTRSRPRKRRRPTGLRVSEAETASNFWQRAGVGDRLLTTILTDAPQAATASSPISRSCPLNSPTTSEHSSAPTRRRSGFGRTPVNERRSRSISATSSTWRRPTARSPLRSPMRATGSTAGRPRNHRPASDQCRSRSGACDDHRSRRQLRDPRRVRSATVAERAIGLGTERGSGR